LQTRSHTPNPRVAALHPAAFTLVETLIVASLVGLLAFIAIPNYIRTRANAAKTACINNLRQIDAGVQQWALELKKTSSSTVTFNDISPFLKYSVVCPAGGTSFADSYSIATVANEPLCLRVPLSHLFPGSGLDLITSTAGNQSGNHSGNPPTIPQLPPGPGNGNGSSARPGPPPRIGPPSLPPSNGNPGQGNGDGNGAGGNGSVNGNDSSAGTDQGKNGVHGKGSINGQDRL
jgi:type II secretory pathway pseudopilin PulG